MNWVLASLISGLISGICWLIGDICLVGFDIDEGKYAEFLQKTGIKNRRMAVLMLSGSVRRLRFGALIANFSIPLMLFSAFSLYALAKPSPWATSATILLAVGFSLSPVAHVAYYYVGTLCKNLHENQHRAAFAQDPEGALVNEYVFFLNITWSAAIGITALGWIVYTILILLGRTAFPPLFFLLTPLFISPLALLLTSKFKIGKPYLNGAGFNVGLTVFFTAALICYLSQSM
ncbi:MAG: DUF6796 family protein [Christensenellales bacterium]|jgi:hypothetical protein